jgi:acetylornithine deacetylase
MSEVLGQLATTLKELVAIDSTSTRSNAPVVDLLERRLSSAGFVCERHRYVDEAGVEKVNLLATTGAGPRDVAELALVGHTDCVPYDAAWKEALVLVERDGRFYGRGACDTKAFIACALTAVDRVGRARLTRSLRLIFTADEELGCFGAKKLLDAGLGRARHAIVGEPTSLVPIRANKGYCLAEVEVKGVEGHSAYPESGASAIFRAGRFLRRLEELSRGELRAEVDPNFEPPFTTVNVGLISGGKAKNVIPGSCRFTVEWRPIPGQPVEKVAELLKRIQAELKREDPAYDSELRISRQDRGVETPASAEVVRFLVEQSGNAPATVAFGTEAPQLTELGAQAVVFGPGNIQVAHRTGEFVPIPELLKCEEILERAILRFCVG